MLFFIRLLLCSHQLVRGSGPDGSVTVADVESFTGAAPAAPAAAVGAPAPASRPHAAPARAASVPDGTVHRHPAQ